jgi:hypothetical protein
MATSNQGKSSYVYNGIIILLTSTSPVAFKERARTDNLLYDVTILIFELLTMGSQTCLGVTCKTLYGDLKKLQPEEISLYANVECRSSKHTFLSEHPDEERLGYPLQDWEV